MGLGFVALVAVALPEFARGASQWLTGISLAAGAVGILCLWLLAEAFWPWVFESSHSRDRKEVDTAVRHAYAILSVLAVAMGLYLLLDQRQELDTFIYGRARSTVWCLLALVLLLPPAMIVWSPYKGRVGWVELEPLQLVRARLSGTSGRLHLAGGLILLGGVPSLVVGPVGPSGLLEFWWMAAIVIAVAAIAACAWVLIRSLLQEGCCDDDA